MGWRPCQSSSSGQILKEKRNITTRSLYRPIYFPKCLKVLSSKAIEVMKMMMLAMRGGDDATVMMTILPVIIRADRIICHHSNKVCFLRTEKSSTNVRCVRCWKKNPIYIFKGSILVFVVLFVAFYALGGPVKPPRLMIHQSLLW